MRIATLPLKVLRLIMMQLNMINATVLEVKVMLEGAPPMKSGNPTVSEVRMIMTPLAAKKQLIMFIWCMEFFVEFKKKVNSFLQQKLSKRFQEMINLYTTSEPFDTTTTTIK